MNPSIHRRAASASGMQRIRQGQSMASVAIHCPPSHHRATLFHMKDALRSSSVCRAVADEGSSGQIDYKAMAARLNQLMVVDEMTARELRQLVVDKWERSYDIRLYKRENRMYLQIMWKFLEQQSFHLNEEEYMQQLDAVAYYINKWGVADTVRRGISTNKSRGPGYTIGSSARCISIPLGVNLSMERSGEWQ